MNDTGFSIEEMRPGHAAEVGDLHARYIENSLLSDLGPGLLGPLYAALLESGYGVGYVLVVDGKVVGFSFGRHSHRLTIGQVFLRRWRSLSGPVLGYLLRRPQALLKILKRLNQSGHVLCEPGVGELLTIVVDRAVRGGSPSVRIAEALFDRLREEGCRSVRWETMEDNQRAQKFYGKIRGRVVKQDEVSGEKVFWYERDLDE